MSVDKFDDNCPCCKPALINMKTGLALPPESPIMQVVNRVWAESTLADREAFHNVCCLNSRTPADLTLALALNQRMKTALEKLDAQTS